ncbi:SLA1 homology domain 1, SHD1-domain-containing protein [Cantharellus anzutake]|uniref:SLA1 homology domain 1, SHD1-domain-containing protein n=1 Tax=Cantharellus anzutake TaxID=1750568 RepID=UPI0019082912|nr:SLA1 homology domain 1, SHD1-domain-containing protein [Cantharellus anzutake]KAF8332684.1 SLA1 homology domain 1, SHD1-domain-containing protein [Cantharellus anzutake]
MPSQGAKDSPLETEFLSGWCIIQASSDTIISGPSVEVVSLEEAGPAARVSATKITEHYDASGKNGELETLRECLAYEKSGEEWLAEADSSGGIGCIPMSREQDPVDFPVDEATMVPLREHCTDGSNPPLPSNSPSVSGSGTFMNPFRHWIDSTGRFRVEAKFVGVGGGEACLHKMEGGTIVVPLSKLSILDQDYIRAVAGHNEVFPAVPSSNELIQERLPWLSEMQSTTPVHEADFRVWCDPTGNFRVVAKYLGMSDSNVRLHKANGVIINVPLWRICSADTDYIRRMHS